MTAFVQVNEEGQKAKAKAKASAKADPPPAAKDDN